MASALALARAGRGFSSPNPNVGCVLVADGRVAGRGATAPGGRPHAEAAALAQAGPRARGAAAYVTLEPCAHASPRGAPCADTLIAAGVARVVVAMSDPDPRTAGQGIARLRAAGIGVAEGVLEGEARAELAGFIRRLSGRGPELTLKLALSLDGRAALPDGRSQWITGPLARAHSHLERLAADAVIVGRATWDHDHPRLDVRLPGHNGRRADGASDGVGRQPQRAILSTTASPLPGREGRLGHRPSGGGSNGATSTGPEAPLILHTLAAIDEQNWQRVLVEGGPGLATALLQADRVDRLLIYRAPIVMGEGRGLSFRLPDLAQAHGRWALVERRPLGPDLLEEYRRRR